MGPAPESDVVGLRIFSTYQPPAHLLLPELTDELRAWKAVLDAAARLGMPNDGPPEIECICRQSPLEIVITITLTTAASSSALLALIPLVERAVEARVRVQDARL